MNLTRILAESGRQQQLAALLFFPTLLGQQSQQLDARGKDVGQTDLRFGGAGGKDGNPTATERTLLK